MIRIDFEAITIDPFSKQVILAALGTATVVEFDSGNPPKGEAANAKFITLSALAGLVKNADPFRNGNHGARLEWLIG